MGGIGMKRVKVRWVRWGKKKNRVRMGGMG